jgi:hypothetical protein
MVAIVNPSELIAIEIHAPAVNGLLFTQVNP